MGDGYEFRPLVYSAESVEEFRQAVLASENLGISGFGEKQLRDIGSRIEAACQSLEAALKAYTETHRGDAAEATQAHIARAVLPGIQQLQSLYVMADQMALQTGAFAEAHRELAAAEESNWGNLFGLLSDARETEVVRAEYALHTSNTVYGGLPVFDPPPTEVADSRAYGAGGGGVGSAGAGLGGVGAGLSPASAAPMPTEVAGAPGGAGVPGGGSGFGPAGLGSGGAGALGGAGGSAGVGPQSPAAGALSVPSGLGGSGAAGSRPGGVSSSNAGVPGLRGTSGLGTGSSSGAAGRWGGAEGVGSRGSTGGVIRPDVPRGGAAESEPAPRARPGAERLAAGEQPRSGVARSGGTAGAQHPFMPASGMAGQGGSSRRRPEWLVEPDPDSYWLADVPPSGPAVIRPDEDDEL